MNNKPVRQKRVWIESHRIIINNVDGETKAALERVKTIYGYPNYAEALKHVMDRFDDD